MRAMEFSKGADAAIGITVAATSMDAFAAEVRVVKTALMEWKAKHQDRCAMVMLTVVAPPEHHGAIAAGLKKIYEEERDLSPLLQSVKVEVSMLDERGKPVKEFSFPRQIQARSRSGKPWWKFW